MKNKNTKRALLTSVLSMLLCVAMLVGSTFAWFTDSVTSGKNKIVAGNLDVELYHTNGAASEEKVEADTKLFVNSDGSDILWEPGVMVYENFTVKNVGSLALKYQLTVNADKFNTVAGTEKSLKDVLKVAILDEAFSGDRADAQALAFDKTIADFAKEGNIAAQAADDTYAIVVYWEPSDIDNDYNLNNGKTSSDGEPLFIDLGVNLIATQDTVENDSFDNQYDKDAALPVSVSTAEELEQSMKTTAPVTLNNDITMPNNGFMFSITPKIDLNGNVLNIASMGRYSDTEPLVVENGTINQIEMDTSAGGFPTFISTFYFYPGHTVTFKNVTINPMEQGANKKAIEIEAWEETDKPVVVNLEAGTVINGDVWVSGPKATLNIAQGVIITGQIITFSDAVINDNR